MESPRIVSLFTTPHHNHTDSRVVVPRPVVNHAFDTVPDVTAFHYGYENFAFIEKTRSLTSGTDNANGQGTTCQTFVALSIA